MEGGIGSWPSVSWSGPVIRSCRLGEEVGGAAGGGRGRRWCVGQRFVVSHPSVCFIFPQPCGVKRSEKQR